MNKPKVLFLSPYCSKNGAEVMLNDVINKISGEITARYFFEHQGILRDEINVESYFLKTRSPGYILNYAIHNIFGTSLSAKEIFLKNIEKANKFDVWYIHTVHMFWVVKLAKRLNKKVIIHLHDYLYQYQFIYSEDFQEAVEYAEVIITCADFIRKDIQNFKVKKCITINECVDFKRVESSLKSEFNISEHPFSTKPYMLMSGTYNYRKGIDLFIEVAEQNHHYNFVCVGGGNTAYKRVLSQKITKKGLDNIFLLAHQNENYYHIVKNCHALLLSSREDPFPLVMIEAAYFGKPVFGFDSGGISEFLTNGMGEVISDFSIEKMNTAISSYDYKNHDKQLSKQRASQFDGAVQSQQILSSIQSI